MTGKHAPWLYFLLGQAGWFACVLSAAHGLPWIGAVVVLALIAAHLLAAEKPIEELKLVVGAMLLGAVWDSLLVRTGLLTYPSGTVVPGFAPYWIVALWASFAAQFNTTYRWLKPHPALAALLGAVAGPLSFRAGAALGALQLVRPWPAFLALAVGWAVLLPTLNALSKRWNGVRDPAPPAPQGATP